MSIAAGGAGSAAVVQAPSWEQRGNLDTEYSRSEYDHGIASFRCAKDAVRCWKLPREKCVDRGKDSGEWPHHRKLGVSRNGLLHPLIIEDFGMSEAMRSNFSSVLSYLINLDDRAHTQSITMYSCKSRGHYSSSIAGRVDDACVSCAHAPCAREVIVSAAFMTVSSRHASTETVHSYKVVAGSESHVESPTDRCVLHAAASMQPARSIPE